MESGYTDVVANFNHTDDSFQFSIAGGYTGFSAGALAFGSSYAGTDTNLDISLDNFISISNATEFANAEAAVYSIATGRGSGALYLTYTNSTTHATTLAYDSNRNDGAAGGTAHDVATLNTVNGTVDHTDIVIAT
ncbi:MAG: hypothetical protein EPN20_10160 [Magnetospirillum sp.]|nr:MAG: hypothetical protein EPN20_10160 [Magnetospirillum sp.]